jgi:hypothetical protein
MKLKADGTPRKKHIYHQFANEENGWRSLQEVGEMEGISKNRVSQIFSGAMEKLAASVFKDLRGRKPNEKELEAITKDESFGLLVAEVLASTPTQSRQDQ